MVSGKLPVFSKPPTIVEYGYTDIVVNIRNIALIGENANRYFFNLWDNSCSNFVKRLGNFSLEDTTNKAIDGLEKSTQYCLAAIVISASGDYTTEYVKTVSFATLCQGKLKVRMTTTVFKLLIF